MSWDLRWSFKLIFDILESCRARLALVILAPTTLWLSTLVLPLFSAGMVHQFSWYCTPLQLQWYIVVISSWHSFHVYIEGLVAYRIDRVLILIVRFITWPANITRYLAIRPPPAFNNIIRTLTKWKVMSRVCRRQDSYQKSKLRLTL